MMKVRRTARLVVIDDKGRVLLLRYEDARVIDHPLNPSRRPFVWVTPGGGVDDDESFEQAACREMWEETGLADAPLGPCVWTKQLDGQLAGVPTHFDERYFLLRVPALEIDLESLEEVERLSYRGHRWWTVDELRQFDELVFPEGLPDLLVPLVADEVLVNPIDISLNER